MSQLVRLGWRECLALPDLGVPRLRAKIDTGARSSSLHVTDETFFERDGRPWVRFRFAPAAGAGEREAEAPLLDRREVTDSGGHRHERSFIRTRLVLAGQAFEAEVNLARRGNMRFPMLVGRTALAGRFIVDPAESFLFGEGGA